MTTVVFPLSLTGEPLAYTITLVRADGITQALGWVVTQPLFYRHVVQVGVGTDPQPVSLEMTPQEHIATVDGSQTHYRVELSGGRGSIKVSVPLSGTYDLESLIAASVADSQGILADRLLPIGPEVGQIPRFGADGPEWMDPPAGVDAVAGPVVAVDGNVALFDGVSGKLLRDGGPPLAGGLSEIEVATMIASAISAITHRLPPDPSSLPDGTTIQVVGHAWTYI